MKNQNNLKTILLLLVLLTTNNLYSQWNNNWYRIFYNDQTPYLFGGHPLSDFNVLAVDNFDYPQQASLLFNHNVSAVDLMFYDANYGWSTWGPGSFSALWSYHYTDRFLTLGTYYSFQSSAANLLLAMDCSNNGGTARLLGPPINPSHNYWTEVWNNNGNGCLGSPGWLVYVSRFNKYLSGDFTVSNNANLSKSGQQLLSWDFAFTRATVLEYDWDVYQQAGTWNRIWYTTGDPVYLGPWPLSYYDKVVCGDFDGDGKDEILIYNSSSMVPYYTNNRAMLLKFVNGTWSAIWDNNKSGYIGSWHIPSYDLNDYAFVGDISYNGYENIKKKEVFFVDRAGGWARLQSYSGIGNGWNQVYTNNGSNQIVGLNNQTLWTLNPTDQIYENYFSFSGGDQCNTHYSEKLLAINVNAGSAALLCYRADVAGCPWIYTYQTDTTGFQPENNILHRSEFTNFAGQDITDKYLLKVAPEPINNQIYIQVAESDHDYNYFDMMKLYAVDHPIGTKIGITENNDIIMYDDGSIQSTDNATLNANTNITPYIQYNSQSKKIVRGVSGDSIYAHYDTLGLSRAVKNFKKRFHSQKDLVNGDSLALVGELGANRNVVRAPYPTPKTYAGTANIYTISGNYSKQFARRERNSSIIIPFEGINDPYVDHIDVTFTNDYEVSYFSVTPVTYSGFSIQELSLMEANNSNEGDILSKLQNAEGIYAELDTSAIITLKFDVGTACDSGTVRDYVFETRGRYLANNSDATMLRTNVRENRSSMKLDYSLSNNYPNPFNPQTTIKYSISNPGEVKVLVFDVLGQVVKELVNKNQDAGTYSVVFDGTNLASGIYFYRLESGSFIETKKMLLIK